MITAVLPQTTDPIPALMPQFLIPSLRYYRQLCPHYRWITAVFPSSPTMQLTILQAYAQLLHHTEWSCCAVTVIRWFVGQLD